MTQFFFRSLCVFLISLLLRDELQGGREICAAAAPPTPAQIELGRHLFTRVWEPALPGPESGDGLGPLFNARSCAECHHQGGVGGSGSGRHNVQFIRPVVAGTESEAGFDATPPGPSHEGRWRSSPVVMLHRFGVRREYAAWRADEIVALTRLDPQVVSTFPNKQPIVRTPFQGPSVGWTLALRLDLFAAPAPTTALHTSQIVAPIRLHVEPPPAPPTAARFIGCGYSCNYRYFYLGPRFWEVNTPPLFGLGLLEQVALADVRAIAAGQPIYIRGRPVILPDGRLGRFGWKAQHASLRDFCDEACAMELGLTTPTLRAPSPPKLHPADDEEVLSPYWRTVRANPDISAAGVDALTTFVAALSRPREQVEASASIERSGEAEIRTGRQWFHSIGCAACHTPDIGSVRGVYSDLLLHEIGTEPEISYLQRIDNEHAAGPGQFRTPPLWGAADSAPYLHDGSAATLEEAVLRHHGQATPANQAYQQRLTPKDREALIAFLRSLRAP